MNLTTGPFDMFFNQGGWRDFLVNDWPLLLASTVVVGALIYYGYKHGKRK